MLKLLYNAVYYKQGCTKYDFSPVYHIFVITGGLL